MKKTYCDRCGDEFDEHYSYPKLMFKYQNCNYVDGGGTDIDYEDLCANCKRSIINFIKTGCKGGDMK